MSRLSPAGFTAIGRTSSTGGACGGNEVNFDGTLGRLCFRDGEGCLVFDLPTGACFLIKEEKVWALKCPLLLSLGHT